VERAIGAAEFLAIDCELTGLTADTPPRDAFCEDPQERYSRLARTDFLIVQYGLSCFERTAAGGWTAHPFNFLLFPQQYTRDAPDPRFVCQASSLRFLASIGFDFNKLIRDGIPWANRECAEDARRKAQERRERNSREPLVLESDADKAFLAEAVRSVKEWLHSETQAQEQRRTLKLPPCNAFRRLVLFQHLQKAFPDILLESERGCGALRSVFVTKVSAEERAEAERKKLEAEENEFQLALGFTKVLEAITASRKPIVGHNMILDLINTIGQFAGPLPSLLADWKVKTTAMFPRVFDTKCVRCLLPLRRPSVPNTSSHSSDTLSLSTRRFLTSFPIPRSRRLTNVAPKSLSNTQR